MRLYRIEKELNKESQAKIYHYNDDGDDILDDVLEKDRYEAVDDVEKAFKKSTIRPDRSKSLSRMIIVDGKVIGGVYSSFEPSGDSDHSMVFSFDVAISPEYRGKNNQGLGDRTIINIIDDMMREFQSYKNESEDRIYCRLTVVNPKLARILESKYGFELTNSGGYIIAIKY